MKKQITREEEKLAYALNPIIEVLDAMSPMINVPLLMRQVEKTNQALHIKHDPDLANSFKTLKALCNLVRTRKAELKWKNTVSQIINQQQNANNH